MKLSIIMPIYNGENYIINTIPYILSHTSSEFELVLVNDGSKDNSLKICRHFMSQDSRVKVVNKNNGGIANARNYGIEKSIGEYICFCDQDDFIEVSIILNIILKYQEDIIIFSTVKDYGNRYEPCDTVKSFKRFNTKREIFDNCIWPMVYPTVNDGNVTYFGHVWQGIYKKEMVYVNNIKFKTFVSIEDDFLFLLEAFLSSKDVLLIPDIGYRWVINLNSTTYSRKYIKDMLEKCENYYFYTNEILKKSDFYKKKFEEKYIAMSRQVLGVRMVINEGNSNHFFKSVRMLREYRKQNNIYFHGEFLGKGASRKSASVIYNLLKKKFIFSVMIFQKFICFLKSVQK